jgi:glycosyltransferase involved in cell wall biosynthesis
MNRGVTFMPQGPWAKVARMGGFYNLKYYQQRVTDLIGNTPHITAYCREHGWPAAHVHMVGNFIPSPPTGWQAQRTAQRAAWGWLPTDVGLVVVGRLHANKGIETALHALATLPENFKLALVGSGPAEQELGRLVKSLGLTGRVVFTGWTNEVSRAASAADMWLVPSLHEPLGNTAIDAWVHSVPLIVSAVGGLDALVEEGMHGLKVPPADAPALAAAITRLQADKALQAKVIKHGTARWLAEYSESKVVGHYLALFAKLAKLDKAAKSA